VRLRFWPVAVAFALGPIVALLGVWVAAGGLVGISPLETLREAVVETAR